MIKKLFLPMPGSKQHIVRRLIELIPPHNAYVEVFGGGATLLLQKPPSPAEIYNDIDGDLVNLFRVIQDEEKFKRFYHKVYWTLYARDEYDRAMEILNNGTGDEVDRAWALLVAIRQSFAGMKNTWGFGTADSITPPWTNITSLLLEIHKRIKPILIEHDDFRNIIARYDRPDTFFYLDPPYYPSTCMEMADIYSTEMSREDYRDLFYMLKALKGKALLSGYNHPIYKVLEDAGWRRVDFPTKAYIPNIRMIRGRPIRVESVWFNYEPEGDD